MAAHARTRRRAPLQIRNKTRAIDPGGTDVRVFSGGGIASLLARMRVKD
jgi:hypothetical protein